MFRKRLCILITLVWVWPLLGAEAATESDFTLKSLTVTAVPESVPILKHTLLPRASEQRTGNAALFDATLDELRTAPDRSIVFTNFVDFDMLYGHRRNVEGYAEALEYLDGRLPELLDLMNKDDLLVLCADHGCDPIWYGSDHTREHIPVLAYGARVEPGPLGKRESFADIGQSLAAFFGLSPMDYGTSFLNG